MTLPTSRSGGLIDLLLHIGQQRLVTLEQLSRFCLRYRRLVERHEVGIRLEDVCRVVEPA